MGRRGGRSLWQREEPLESDYDKLRPLERSDIKLFTYESMHHHSELFYVWNFIYKVMKKPSIVMTPEVEEAIRNTPGAVLMDNGDIKLLVSRYQKPEQAGSTSVRTGVFYLPEVKSPYGKHYRSGQNKGPNASYGGSQYITGQITIHKPYIVKAGTGGLGPERAYINLMGKAKHEQLTHDIFSMVVNRGGYFSTPNHAVVEEWVQELLTKYKCDPDYDTAYNIVAHSNVGNRMRYALQEHIIARMITSYKLWEQLHI